MTQDHWEGLIQVCFQLPPEIVNQVDQDVLLFIHKMWNTPK